MQEMLPGITEFKKIRRIRKNNPNVSCIIGFSKGMTGLDHQPNAVKGATAR